MAGGMKNRLLDRSRGGRGDAGAAVPTNGFLLI
jgi:hypothetical protein